MIQRQYQYFDSVSLINKEVMAYGKVSEVFNDENIKKTYKERNIFKKLEI